MPNRGQNRAIQIRLYINPHYIKKNAKKSKLPAFYVGKRKRKTVGHLGPAYLNALSRKNAVFYQNSIVWEPEGGGCGITAKMPKNARKKASLATQSVGGCLSRPLKIRPI